MVEKLKKEVKTYCTYYLDMKVVDNFRKLCKRKGFNASRKLNILMKDWTEIINEEDEVKKMKEDKEE